MRLCKETEMTSLCANHTIDSVCYAISAVPRVICSGIFSGCGNVSQEHGCLVDSSVCEPGVCMDQTCDCVAYNHAFGYCPSTFRSVHLPSRLYPVGAYDSQTCHVTESLLCSTFSWLFFLLGAGAVTVGITLLLKNACLRSNPERAPLLGNKATAPPPYATGGVPSTPPAAVNCVVFDQENYAPGPKASNENDAALAVAASGAAPSQPATLHVSMLNDDEMQADATAIKTKSPVKEETSC